MHLDVDEEQSMQIADIREVKDLDHMMAIVREGLPELPPYIEEEHRYCFKIKD